MVYVLLRRCCTGCNTEGAIYLHNPYTSMDNVEVVDRGGGRPLRLLTHQKQREVTRAKPLTLCRMIYFFVGFLRYSLR